MKFEKTKPEEYVNLGYPQEDEVATKDLEMHFIEIPKLNESCDEKDMLVAWTEFLKNPESEKVRSLEMSVEEIREAKDELIRMNNDSTQRELCDMRANSLRDKISELNLSNRLSGANGPVDTLDASDNVTVMGALSVGGGVEV